MGGAVCAGRSVGRVGGTVVVVAAGAVVVAPGGTEPGCGDAVVGTVVGICCVVGGGGFAFACRILWRVSKIGNFLKMDVVSNESDKLRVHVPWWNVPLRAHELHEFQAASLFKFVRFLIYRSSLALQW